MRNVLLWGIVLLAVLCVPGLAAKPAKPAPDPTILPKETKIFRIVVNAFWQVNCYILAGKTGQAILIDPGDELDMLGGDSYRATGTDAARIDKVLTDNKLTPKLIILSHGHLDHIGSIGYLKKKYPGVQIMMHAGDVKPKGDPHEGCPKDTRMFEGGLPKVDKTLKEDELVKLDGMVLRVIHTPGHSPGSICLLTHQEKRTLLFSGDTLLYHTVGRTNFRDGSGDQDLEFKNIREKLYTLPDDTIVLTGHYDFTTIGEEKKNNPFVPAVPPPPVPPVAAPDAGMAK